MWKGLSINREEMIKGATFSQKYFPSTWIRAQLKSKQKKTYWERHRIERHRNESFRCSLTLSTDIQSENKTQGGSRTVNSEHRRKSRWAKMNEKGGRNEWERAPETFDRWITFRSRSRDCGIEAQFSKGLSSGIICTPRGENDRIEGIKRDQSQEV